MSDIAAPAQAPIDDIFATNRPELKIGIGYAWSADAKPLSSRHALLRAGIFLYLAITVITLLDLGVMMYLFSRFQSASQEDFNTPYMVMLVNFIEVGATFLPMAVMAIFGLCVVFYSMFVYRAVSNLDKSRARNLTVSPAWAVGWSFIPFANLGMIFNVMRQIWIASRDPQHGRQNPPVAIVIWWAAWIASGILGNITTRLTPTEAAMGTMSPEEYFAAFTPSAILSVIQCVGATISCLCLMHIIKQITAFQEALRNTAAFDE